MKLFPYIISTLVQFVWTTIALFAIKGIFELKIPWFFILIGSFIIALIIGLYDPVRDSPIDQSPKPRN